MALPKLFQRIFWHNNTTPDINEDNLNAMSKAIDDIDNRLITIASDAYEKIPEIEEDMEILGPAIENIDANVTRAETAADNAETEALKSEGYAAGTQDGVEVTSGEYYQKNAKYYAEIANPPIENTVDFADIITISDAINKAAKDVRLKVEAVQDLHGYDKPWVGGAGKNLYNKEAPNVSSIANKTSITQITNGIRITAVESSSYLSTAQIVINDLTSYVGKSITFKCKYTHKSSDGILCALQALKDGTEVLWNTMNGIDGEAWTTVSITSAHAGATLYFRTYISGSNTISVGDYTEYTEIQIEVGTTATSYEPYKNICPLTGWDNAKVTRARKNLHAGTYTSGTTANVVFTANNDGTVSANGTLSSGYGMKVSSVFFLKAGTYKINGNPLPASSGKRTGMKVETVEGETVTRILEFSNATEGTFTLTKDSNIKVSLICYENGQSFDVVFKPMIRFASDTDDTFESYQGKEITISLDGTRYGGTLDVTSGVLTLTKAIYDLGDYSYNHNTGDNRNYFYTTVPISAIKGFANNTANDGISNKYVADSWNNIMASNPTANGKFAISSDKYFGIRDDNANSMSTSDFKTYVTGTKIIATLATPQTIQLTAEEIDLLYGYNTLFGDCGDISLTYDASGIIHIDEAKLDTETLKTIAAASSDFADFKARIAAL